MQTDIKEKKKQGGSRPGAGRKRRMEEEEIIEKLHPMSEKAFKVLEERIEFGDLKAVQIFLSYYIGLPTQKVENKIEGSLNRVDIEIIKPDIKAITENVN